MDKTKDLVPNNKEFVVMSLEGYKKLAKINSTGENLYWTTDINTEVPIKFKFESFDGRPPIIPKTIPQLLLQNAREYEDWPSYHTEPTPGNWTFWTWGEVWETSFAFARALVAFGVSHRSSVNIIGFNSETWMYAFHGTIIADCIVAGVYPTNNPAACQYVADHSGAEVIVAENEEHANKYLEVLDQLPRLKAIVVYGVDEFDTPKHSMLITWKQFLEFGDKKDTETDGKYTQILHERMEKQVPGKCCNIVYTSGTTGNPKGVMLTHDNMIFVVYQTLINLEDEDIQDGRERIVSYLPLSHSAAQITDIMTNLVARTQIYFARPDALQGTLVDTLQHAKPTLFVAVPRVWEKMEERLKEVAATMPSFLQSISSWAKSKGTLMSEARMFKGQAPWGIGLANLLVLNRVKKALGLEQAKALLVSAAPMKKATFEYFKSLDLPIVNVYGMSECAGPETCAKPGKYKQDAVGYAFQDTHIKIDRRDKTEGGQEGEGEICFRGRNNFIGYLNNEKATRETLDQDGYIHSGDLGTKDSEGFVRITGRIKELIITAGGENVAPVLIEDSLKSICPIINNVMVIGDDRKYLSALITFKVEVDMTKGMGTPTTQLTSPVKAFLKEELGITGVKTTEEAVQNEKIMNYLDQKVKENNEIAISRAQHIRKFKVLANDFSLEGGELTPTLKLRRKIAYEKYKDIIEEMYTDEDMTAKM